MLAVPDRRVPKKTKPTPGLCAKGLPKLESAISAIRIARIVRAAPWGLFGIADCSLNQQRSALRRDRIIAVASGTPNPSAIDRIAKYSGGCGSLRWFKLYRTVLTITHPLKMYATGSAHRRIVHIPYA